MEQEQTKLVYYRTTILYFNEDPYHKENQIDACNFFLDGLLIINEQTGLVEDSGNYTEILQKYSIKEEEVNTEYVGKLVMPGFIDCHTHFPQSEMTCSYSPGLIQWLNTYTFPTEGQFYQPEYADKISRFYLNELLKNGTTSALVFASVHAQSVKSLFNSALDLNMRVICGKTLMDRNAPEYLQDTPELADKESRELIEQYHKKGRLLYSVTPRFAPTSSPQQLEKVAKIIDDHPDIWIHTHLNENLQEIEWVKSLFPECESYLKVYEKYNMVQKQACFAHCVHCNPDDFQTFRDHGCGAAYCPTSNGFLGAGIFDYHRSVKENMNFGMGTDIGGGTSFSLIRTLQDAYKLTMLSQVHTDQRRPMTALEGFYRATLGGAKALSIDDKVGKLSKGFEADFVVLDWAVTELEKLKFESLDKKLEYGEDKKLIQQKQENLKQEPFKLQEKLFGVMMLGGTENVYATHIAGIQKYHKTQ